MKTAVFTFGRANPPTVGHEKLFKKVSEVAIKNKADAFIYLSQTQDKKKNPLSYQDKIAFVKQLMPKYQNMVQKDTSIKTIIDQMKKLNQNYKKVILVVGSDRVSWFKKLLEDYNGKDYTFDSIDVVSAGERDPDAEGVEGMSASKMRELASKNNFDEFKKGLQQTNQKLQKEVFLKVRQGMGLNECEEFSIFECEDTFQQELEQFINDLDDQSLEEYIPTEYQAADDGSLKEFFQLMKNYNNTFLLEDTSFKERQLFRQKAKRRFINETKLSNKESKARAVLEHLMEGFDSPYIPDSLFVALQERLDTIYLKKFTGV